MRLGLLASVACLLFAGCGDLSGPSGPQAPSVEAGALQAAVRDSRVRRFYEARQWRPAWTREAEESLRAALDGANRHGLEPDEFRRPLAAAREGAAREAALSLAALSYAEALARGRTDPTRLYRIYEIPRPDPNLTEGLERVLSGDGEVRAWVESLAPQDADYRALAAAYVDARRQVDAARGRATPEQTDRMRILAVNLERRRWLERTAPATRIDVNTASAMLTYWRDGRLKDTRRVVVGSAGDRATPSLSAPMFQLVANPTWTVPRSIGMSAAYMARRGFTIRNGRRVQPSGPNNALGLVKFDLRNGHAIYLHDTPSKSLFLRDERHASHGCVRVHNALEFAEIIARDEGVLQQWQRAQRPPAAARQSRPARDADGNRLEPAPAQPAPRRYVQRWIPLPREIPVRLLYHTAFVEDGQVKIVRDVYGRDERVAAALGLPPRVRPARRTGPGTTPADVGP